MLNVKPNGPSPVAAVTMGSIRVPSALRVNVVSTPSSPSGPGAPSSRASRSVTTSTSPVGENETWAQPEPPMPLSRRVDPGMGSSWPAALTRNPVTDGVPVVQFG